MQTCARSATSPTAKVSSAKRRRCAIARGRFGPDKRLIRIVLHGLRGLVTVADGTFNMDMPSLAALSDEQIAGALTFVRRAWGHQAPPVDPKDVQSIRDWTQARRDAWTQEELLKIR